MASAQASRRGGTLKMLGLYQNITRRDTEHDLHPLHALSIRRYASGKFPPTNQPSRAAWPDAVSLIVSRSSFIQNSSLPLRERTGDYTNRYFVPVPQGGDR